jgi:hypothetical protein
MASSELDPRHHLLLLRHLLHQRKKIWKSRFAVKVRVMANPTMRRLLSSGMSTNEPTIVRSASVTEAEMSVEMLLGRLLGR